MIQGSCGISWFERLSRYMALCVMAVSLLGCGGAQQAPKATGLTDDQKAVNSMVGSISDYASSLERLKSKFVKGKAPKSSDLPKFSGVTISTDGDIVIAGDTATVPVAIMKYDANGNAQPPVKQTWKFAKEGGEWKYAETPL